jgi:lipooligosaccharide transport system ATP-binding protein
MLPRLRSIATRIEPLADRVLVYTEDGDETMVAIADDEVQPASTFARRASLEDVFLILTGRTLEE